MAGLPDVLYVVDTRREDIAVREAKSLGIPIVAMVDTNCDPDPVTFVIPSNDDAIRALKVITDKVAEAVDEGLHERQAAFVDEGLSQEEAVDTTQRVFDPFEEEADDDQEDDEA